MESRIEIIKNLAMSGHYIYDSLSTNAQNKVSSYADQYRINRIISGPVLLPAVVVVTQPRQQLIKFLPN